MSDPWRVVLPDGRVMGVAVHQTLGGDWKSYCEERAYSGHGATPFLAVLDVMPFVVGDADSASEIVPPGEMTRAEAVAAETAAVVAYLDGHRANWISAAERRESECTNVGDSLGAALRAYAAENGDRAREIERGEHRK